MKGILATVVCLFVISGTVTAKPRGPPKAVCKVDKDTGVSGTSVEGIVEFEKTSTGEVKVSVNLTGFSGGVGTKHGFHVHKNGSMDNQCGAADGHFNPAGVNHGGRTDTVRHVGDLGNIVEQDGGVVVTEFLDNVIMLSGENTIIGRAMVIHAGEDDLGQGGDEGSLKTGNAGARMACCLIEMEGTSGAPSIKFNIIFLMMSALVGLSVRL